MPERSFRARGTKPRQERPSVVPAGGFRWPRLSASVQIQSPRLFSETSPSARTSKGFLIVGTRVTDRRTCSTAGANGRCSSKSKELLSAWSIRGSNPVASFGCPQAEAERKKRGQQAEELLYWESFEWLRHQPTEENPRAAKRAFDFLTKRSHPDQAGTHEGFLRLKDSYDRQCLHFGTPPRRILWDSGAGRAGRRLRQDHTSSMRWADGICDA